MALVMRILRVQASVELKVVRQVHTPSRSSRLQPLVRYVVAWSKTRRSAITTVAGYEALVWPEGAVPLALCHGA
jgi:hypothetical protein